MAVRETLEKRKNKMTEQKSDKLIEAIFGEAASTFKVGDVVVTPTWMKLTQRQARVNFIIHIHEPGEYVVLVKVLESGEASQDYRAAKFIHIRHLSSLRHFDK